MGAQTGENADYSKRKERATNHYWISFISEAFAILAD